MSCRVTSFAKKCGYLPEGIDRIYLLDFDDFNGYKFTGDSLSDISDVENIFRSGDFAILDANGSGKYTQGKSGKIYTHTIESFLEDFDADTVRNLNLGVNRRFLVAFRANSGRYFVFGQPGGAALTYELQTDGGSGAAITIRCSSLAPLFETSLDAINGTSPRSQYVPSFTTGAACELDGTGHNTGFLQASVAFRVSVPGGLPIDINGVLTRVSGNKQAIALLEGASNPDPALYEVAYTFAAGALVDGQSSLLLSTDSCPKGYLTITPAVIAMDPGDTQIAFQLESGSSWWVVTAPANANISPSQGSTGIWSVRVFFDTNAAINTVLTFQNADGQTASVTVTRDAYFGAFSDGYSNGFQN